MGKRKEEMTKEEINAQKERAMRNYYGRPRLCVVCGEKATGWKYCDAHKAYLLPKAEPLIGRSRILEDVMRGKRI